MSNTPAVAYKDAVKIAEYLGFKAKNKEGSHGQFKHPQTNKKVTLPAYNKECYGKDLLASIYRQLGINKKDFFAILKKLKKKS